MSEENKSFSLNIFFSKNSMTKENCQAVYFPQTFQVIPLLKKESTKYSRRLVAYYLFNNKFTLR